LKKLWLRSVRGYIKLGLFFYFNKIKVFNSESIPDNKPILFLANHQNALIDALLIATTNKRFTFFLTRAGVFNNAFISTCLKSLNMIPVYRIRDGWNNLSNNAAVFESCSQLLNQEESIAIFPEGNHDLRRTVRPLSKGFTRIVFDTFKMYPNLNMQLISVGLNYENAEFFGGSVSINYGIPIDAKQFNSDNRNEAVIKLKETIFNELTTLTTHIPAENYSEILKKLEDLKVDFLDPKSVNACIASNLEKCNSSKIKGSSNGRSFFKLLLIASLIVPYVIWKLAIQPKVKEKEFTSTFRFALAITVVPVYICMVMFILGSIFGFQIAFLYLFSVLLLELCSVKM
jgi:1-acyl-sn-glycerol-3-phosphate acyltransferase